MSVKRDEPWPTNPWDMQPYPSRLVFGRAAGPDGVPHMIFELQAGPASVKAILTAAAAADWLAKFESELRELRRTPIVRRSGLHLPNGQQLPPPGVTP
jgi:hypothetical protein